MTSGKDVARPYSMSLDESPETLDFTAALNPTRSADPVLARREVFADRDTPEIFRSVCHRHEIWRDDPFDVATIHGSARNEFERLISNSSTRTSTFIPFLKVTPSLVNDDKSFGG